MSDYPAYNIKFTPKDGGGVRDRSSSTDPFGPGVRGSHRVKFSVPGRMITLELSHVDEQDPIEPNLVFTVTQVPDGDSPDGGPGGPGVRKAAKRKPGGGSAKKAAKKSARKTAKKSAKKTKKTGGRKKSRARR